MIEAPQSFVVQEECKKVAWQHGFRRNLGVQEGWASFGSTTAQGAIYLGAEGANGPWFLSLGHMGATEELGLPAEEISSPGIATYAFNTLGELYGVMPRVYQLFTSLPDAPLQEFLEKTKDLPCTTEAERLVVQRVGQEVFRNSLIDYWQGYCPLTGISDSSLLRASHIIPWKDCTTDAERLDVHNGLLLSALWDAAFDRGLVTFEDNGCPIFSPTLSTTALKELRWDSPIAFTDKHRERITHHRSKIFRGIE